MPRKRNGGINLPPSNPIKQLMPKGRERRSYPLMGNNNGKLVIMCPFCDPPHPISIKEVAQCGTRLDVQAVQLVFKHQKCALCGKMDGELVQIGNQFRHVQQCTPGAFLFAEPPPRSLLAGIVDGLPDRFQVPFAKLTGLTPIALTSADGKPAGHAWRRVQVK